MGEYLVGMAATATFSITGVLAIGRKDVDLFGLTVFGIISALGGGTVRDIILGVPIFWLEDFIYIWVAIGAALATFMVRHLFRRAYRLLLYMDALGVALFSVLAIDKALALGHIAPVGVIMGLITAIGGGLIRDVLSGRPNLLTTRELYATPILLGSILYTFQIRLFPEFDANASLAMALIFFLRAAAIRFRVAMPMWLVMRGEDGEA